MGLLPISVAMQRSYYAESGFGPVVLGWSIECVQAQWAQVHPVFVEALRVEEAQACISDPGACRDTYGIDSMMPKLEDKSAQP